jgi:hypothetical protein
MSFVPFIPDGIGLGGATRLGYPKRGLASCSFILPAMAYALDGIDQGVS